MKKRWMKYASLFVLIVLAVILYLPSGTMKVSAEEGDSSGDGASAVTVATTDGVIELKPWGDVGSADATTIDVRIVYNSDGGEFTIPSDVEYKTLPDSDYHFTEESFSIILADAPTKEGYIFAGWSCSSTKESGGMIEGKVYEAGASTESITSADYDDVTITFTAQWTNTISTAGTYELKAGTEYKLGEGKNWTVNGDGKTYTGGSSFYVKTGGSYTFS